MLTGLALATSLCVGGLPCTCVLGQAAEPPNRRAAYLDSFDAVFEGDVIAWTSETRSSPIDSTRSWHFHEAVVSIAVRRRWKGAPSDTVVVRTALDTAACGFYFGRSGRYLVFATAAPGVGLVTTKCSPSMGWGDHAERLAEVLGPPVRRP